MNVWRGNRSLLEHTATGDWRPLIALSVAGLACGFFWEMWNYYSYPKWVYHVPFVGVLHVFEMPLLGYLGYLVFASELHVLIIWWWGRSGGRRASCGSVPTEGDACGPTQQPSCRFGVW